MEMLRGAINAQTKYTILVIYSNVLQISGKTLLFKENTITCIGSSFPGYNRDGDRQSLTGTT